MTFNSPEFIVVFNSLLPVGLFLLILLLQKLGFDVT